MGRPELRIRVQPDLKRDLFDLAHELDVSASKVVSVALRRFLGNAPNEKPAPRDAA